MLKRALTVEQRVQGGPNEKSQTICWAYQQLNAPSEYLTTIFMKPSISPLFRISTQKVSIRYDIVVTILYASPLEIALIGNVK